MEYWIVDPIYQSVEIYLLEDDKYALKSTVFEGEVASHILEGFTLTIENIFEESDTEGSIEE